MRVVIVYESLFGNTHEIAEAIGDGVREAQPDVQVFCLRVTEASQELVRGADLLVVGGPTHMRGMTFDFSRRKGLETEAKETHVEDADHEPEPDAAGPGVRDWFKALPKAEKGSRAAAFDTRVDFRLAGGAAHGIARRLRRHGYELVAEPEGFLVKDTEGPLNEGEHGRATAWGSGLVAAGVR